MSKFASPDSLRCLYVTVSKVSYEKRASLNAADPRYSDSSTPRLKQEAIQVPSLNDIPIVSSRVKNFILL